MSSKRYYTIRLRHLLTGTILTVSLLTAIAITALAAAPRGRFETVNSTTINSWAYSSSAPGDALNVRISVKDKNTGEEVFSQRMTAGEYGDKLYGNGKGSGCHTFTLNMGWSVLSGGVYLVEGYVGDNDFSNPRTYTNGDPDTKQKTPAAQAQNLVPLGVFKTIEYCPCRACSGGWGHHICTDAVATVGHTIAVDPRIIPYGSKVMINGVVYTAGDRGGAVRGNHIDIFFGAHAETRQHGTQSAEVYLVQSQRTTR